MSNKDKLDRFRTLESSIVRQGCTSPKEADRLSARGRLQLLFDDCKYEEFGLLVKHRSTTFGMQNRDIAAEGVVTVFGKVGGRPVVAISEDYSSMAGTFGEYHGKKFIRAIDLALEVGCPVVTFNESAGLRLQEGIDALECYGALFRKVVEASGVIPQISLLMGSCFGGQAYYPVCQDFIIQVSEYGLLGIAGPEFVKQQTGEVVTAEKLGSERMHFSITGQSHFLAGYDKDAIDCLKLLLSYLPSSNRETSLRVELDTQIKSNQLFLDSILPEDTKRPFSMSSILDTVFDSPLLEVQAGFANNCIIGFGRLEGRVVGILANNSEHYYGVIDVDASDKMARFIRFCDAFNIPLISFHDCPGYMIGLDQESKGILRHGAKLLFAWAECTVPCIAVVVRKSYAGAHFGMLNKSIGADYVLAWPTAVVAPVGAKTATKFLFKATDSTDIEAYKEEYETPYKSAERGFIDGIILPSETRSSLVKILNFLENKKSTNKYSKEHSNCPT